MKKPYVLRIFVLTISMSIAGILSIGAVQAASQKQVVLRFNTFMPDATPPAIAAKEACKMIEERSNGEIKMEQFYSGSLLSFEDSVQGIANGVADIGLVSQALIDTTFFLNQIFTRPLEITPPDNANAAKAYRELVKNIPELNEELQMQNVRWLALQSLPSYNLHTLKDVVKTPADVAGMKLEAQGGVEYWTSLGAAAMVLNPADNYMSLDRGLVKGQVTHWALMNVYKTGELLKTHTIFGEGDGGLYCPVMGYFINYETWKNLSAEHRQILEDAFTYATERTIEFDKVPIENGKKFAKERGDVFVQLTGDELQPWLDAMKPLNQKWIEDLEGKGLPARKTYAELMSLLQKYKK